MKWKIQYQEGVLRKLFKFQGKRTSPSYANDAHCAALQHKRNLKKRARTSRLGNVRAVISAREIIAEHLFLSQQTCVIADNGKSTTAEAVPTVRRVCEELGGRNKESN